MWPAPEGARRRQRGITLIELLIVVAIVALVASIAIPVSTEALRKSRAASVIANSSELYRALMRFNVDNSAFPSITAPPETAFDLVTLAPLTTDGYFRGAESYVSMLFRNRVLLYVAYNVGGGTNNECFALVTSEDSRTILVAAHTQFLPWGAVGDWYDGVYQWVEGEFIPVQEIH